MEELKTLYYERFIQHVVEQFSPIIKNAQSGHCMKITGLAMKELQVLLPKLRPLNASLSVFILSEDEKGDNYIHASKLIELRNDPQKSVLILVPSNSRTSAEDSYGDATFQNLSTASLQDSFYSKLKNEIPQDKKYLSDQIFGLLKETDVNRSQKINYLLYLELNHYCEEAWGNGLFLFGLLPDSDLVKDNSADRRRFMLNLGKVSAVLGDFSLTPTDRIAGLPLQRFTVQEELMNYLNNPQAPQDKFSLFQDIIEHQPQFNYAALPWLNSGSGGQIKLSADVIPSKTGKTENELVNSDDTLILNIQTDKKGKVKLQIVTDPSPKDNPDIVFFEIILVSYETFEEVGTLKKTKITTNKGAKRNLTINIAFEMFDDGPYFIRVRALDANGIVLDNEKKFKIDQVQASWEDELKNNSNLQMEPFRLERKYLYSNETDVFNIESSNEDGTINTDIERRAKINSFTQALIQYRSSRLAKNEDLEFPDGGIKRKWTNGSLVDTYQIDFCSANAYQIQLSKKLIQLERTFLENDAEFGYVEALLGANSTDTKLRNPHDTAIDKPFFAAAQNLNIPDELSSLRSDLFCLIKESADDDRGLTCTLDFSANISILKEYLSQYDCWLRDVHDAGASEEQILAIQNLDTVFLTVEMPDGTTTNLRLISPLHPLRLSWMVNLFELYQDWEEKTLENPNKYRKAWYRKLDKLFLGKIPMDIAPLVLSNGTLKEPLQYIGEITFGWGAYAQPSFEQDEAFASSFRQLKSYTATLLNVTKEKCIDSELSLDMVVRHLQNYALSHPYTDKLVINLFNAGDATIFAQALVQLEKIGIGHNLSYEIRLFADNNMLQSGETFKNLLDPEYSVTADAEVFSQASTNRLFPKLRFSLNMMEEFIVNHDNFQAHISFLINPFKVSTELVRPSELGRSFYLNGTICRTIVESSYEGKKRVWNRYFSNKTLINPVTESANTEVSIFAQLQETVGRLLSSTWEESVPATTLHLKENDIMLLSFVHDSSDWVVTFDKNMGPEFYDLPCSEENDVPYLLDYVPSEETTGISAFLTTRPTSEINAMIIPLFKRYNINLEDKQNFRQILEDIRSVSSSLLMQVNATSNKGLEVVGTALTKRFLSKKHIMKESFIIPIDLHKELFADLDSNKPEERADNLVVKINVDKKEILFSVVEIKCRNTAYNEDELNNKILNQIENTILALRTHFEISPDGQDRLDRELKTMELRSFLEFYVCRAKRYKQLAPEVAHEYLVFCSKLQEGYTIRFKQLGVIFNFLQEERQKKTYDGEAVIYTMGLPVVNEILDDNSTLNTAVLNAKDDFINFFESTQASILDFYNSPKDDTDNDNKQDENITKTSSSKATSNTTTSSSASSENEENQAPSSVDNSQHITEVPIASGETQPTEDDKVEEHTAEIDYSNYVEPKCDLAIGNNSLSSQFGIIGKTINNGRKIGLDLNECNTISLFGIQGAGKSYTIGSITEMVLKQFSNVNKLPSPMASVIFHYSDSIDYAPEFTSMVFPNDKVSQLEKLKAEYGAEPNSIKDVVLLAPRSQVENRKAEYPNIEVHPIGFDSAELTVKDWRFLLAAMGNDSTYLKELNQIMKNCRNNMSLQNIRDGVAKNNHLSAAQRSLAEQKLDFAEEYITDGTKLSQLLHPGRLIIVDLRDEFIEKDEALGLFVVMLNIFSSVTKANDRDFNKFIVFDEAHKYMNNKELVDSITTAIREMRHKGTSIMIASQDPMSLPTEIIELSSIVVMHKFSSPAWVKHVQKAITPLQTLTATEMASLGSGEAFLWANKATDKSVTQRPVKISIRPRITKHGGDTISAVK